MADRRCAVPVLLLAALAGCADRRPEAGPPQPSRSLAAAPDSFLALGPDLRLRYREFGSGVPVVLLHGFTASLEAVAPLADSLGRDHRVIALDQRGHGQSSRPSDARAYGREMGEDVVRLLDHLGIPQAHLVGHSMGAVVSAYVAVQHRDRVATVSLIAPPFFADSGVAAAALAPVVAELEGGGGFLAFFERFAPEMPDSLARGVSADMLSTNDRAMLIGVMRSFPDLGVGRAGAARATTPAVVVVGSLDTLRVEDRALAGWWPGARYVEVDSADHVSVFSNPATLAAIRQHIDAPSEGR